MGIISNIRDAFKPPDPKELVRKWQREVRAEQRKVERDIREVEVEQKKMQANIRDAAKRNDMGSLKILGKSFIHSKKVMNRLYSAKANLIGINTQLQQQSALVRVTGHLEKSSEVMVAVSQCMSVPKTAATMREMQKEMYKAGLIEEVMEEGIADAMGDDEVEEEAEEEVNKVLEEVAGDIMASMPGAPAKRREAAEVEQVQEAMQQRLQWLRS